MRVTELAGYLVEVQNPEYVRGILVAWVSSPRPDRRILGTGRADTPIAACIAAVEDWQSRPPERMTAREERIGRKLLSELRHPTGN